MCAPERRISKPQVWNRAPASGGEPDVTFLAGHSQRDLLRGCDVCQEVGISARRSGIPFLAASIQGCTCGTRCVPLSRGTRWPGDVTAPTRGCSILRGRQQEQLQPLSLWSHTELNVERVLRDPWRFPRTKPRNGGQIIPDQMSLSAASAALARSRFDCLHLPSCPWVLPFASASAWASRRASWHLLFIPFFFFFPPGAQFCCS